MKSCRFFWLDEVGQFIGSNSQLMLSLQTITEQLGTQCKGRAWVIVTSQEDIDATIAEAGLDMLNAVWPERDGFQADLDAARAGSEPSNLHLKKASQDVEQAVLTLAMS
jgi:Tat protein secretion system quality control protein TatD with DNase activity